MDAAHVDPFHPVAVAGECRERVDGSGEHDPGPRIRFPLGESLGRLGRGREHYIDVRRDAHAVEILLPFAGAHRVVHHHDESDMERLPPAHDHLTVNQTVIDAVEHDTHAGVRIALLPASAARRAASSGGRSRWNTKSSSIARLTPVTTARFVLLLASRMELVRQEPPGRSTNSTAGCWAIAAVPRAVKAPESQPSLLTGTRASSTPVIAATAAFSACATAACETITPRSRWFIATTSQITVRFLPGLRGTVTSGTVISRSCVVWPSSPVRSYSRPASQSSSCTTTSMRFCCRTARTPNSARMSIKPTPRISM